MLRSITNLLKGDCRKAIFTNNNLIDTNCIKLKAELAQVKCITTAARQFYPRCNLNIGNITNNILRPSLNRFLLQPKVQSPTVPCRTVTKFSLRSGKRKSVKTVLKRFYRLNWGIWIRTIAGRHKRLWKKSQDRRIRAKHHVFTNSTQSWMLDRMVTKFWKRPKYFVDDPYTPYHTREEFPFTQRKPKPLS